MVNLSILYCTAREKTNIESIKALMPSWCEIVVIKNNGEKPLGYYRKQAVNLAQGKYVVVIDDDDEIYLSYFNEIKKGIDLDVDLISVMENQYKDNELIGYSVSGFQNPKLIGSTQLRGVGHRDAVKRDLVIQCGNYDERYSRNEDSELSMRLHPILKTAYYVDVPIYKYYISSKLKLYDKHLQAPLRGVQIEDYYV